MGQRGVELDKDWVQLMMEAKQIGLEIKAVRDFLEKRQSENDKGTFVQRGGAE